MSDRQREELEVCTIMCPRCNAKYETSLEVEFCSCIQCGTNLKPTKHIVIESEEKVN